MPKILRKDQKIFAGSVAPTNVVAQYGSLAAGAKTYSSDLDLIQALPVWGTGWLNALINGSAPALQDRNAIDYVTTYQLAYLMEQGIPDYSATQNYFVGSYCKDETTGVMHVSKTNDNSNNVLSDSTNWEPVTQAGRGSVPIGGVIAVSTDYANVSIPTSGSISVEGFQLCDGAPLNVDATIGAGTILGANTPNLTDNRFLRGSNGSGNTGGSTTKTLAEANLPSHDHSIDHDHPSATSNSDSHHHQILRNTQVSSNLNVTSSNYISWYYASGTNSANYAMGATGSTANVGRSSSDTHNHSFNVPNYSGSSGSKGSGTAFNVEPSYLNVTYLIRVK